MPCTSLPGYRNRFWRVPAAREGRQSLLWLAIKQAGILIKKVVSGWRTRDLRPRKPARGRSGWPTLVGTTAPRITSSPTGNGLPAGAAALWFTQPRPRSARRKSFSPALGAPFQIASERLNVFSFPVEIPLDFAGNNRIVSAILHNGILLRSDLFLPPRSRRSRRSRRPQ